MTYFFVTAALVAKVVAESIETYRVLGNLVEVLLWDGEESDQQRHVTPQHRIDGQETSLHVTFVRITSISPTKQQLRRAPCDDPEHTQVGSCLQDHSKLGTVFVMLAASLVALGKTRRGKYCGRVNCQRWMYTKTLMYPETELRDHGN